MLVRGLFILSEGLINKDLGLLGAAVNDPLDAKKERERQKLHVPVREHER